MFRNCFVAALAIVPLSAYGAESGLYLQAWRIPLVPEEPVSWHPEERAVPAAAIAADLVFSGSSSGTMRAFDSSTGAPVWRYEVGARIDSAPLVADDRLYFGATDGAMYALNLYNGRLDWKYQTQSVISAKPVAEGGRIFVRARQNQLIALDAKTGKWLWHYQREAPTGFTVESAAAPLVFDGMVFAGFSDGHAVGLNAHDGSAVWTRKLTKKPQFTDVWGTPVADRGKVFFAAFADGLVCLDARTGAEAWRVDLPGASAPVVAGDRLVITTADGEAAALDRSGKIVSRRKLRTGALGAPVAAGDEYVAVSAPDGPVYVLRERDLKIAQIIHPGPGVSAAPLLTRKSLYFISNRGVLYKYAVSL
ncbi:MAG: PQQ-binding-like beta-propeller repeat protein [Deltaproteobacteria bacterium]|nr:PQQ-binding-like beta-propeller repeat protein [Deltaproteobacteria bacterium]